MTMTTDRELIPEEKCAHRELEHSTLDRAYCPDCGFLVDLGARPVFTAREMENATEKAWGEGYEDGREKGGDDEAEVWEIRAMDVESALGEALGWEKDPDGDPGAALVAMAELIREALADLRRAS